MDRQPTLQQLRDQAYFEIIYQRLQDYDGNQSAAAASLGVTRQCLAGWVKRLDIPKCQNPNQET